jgi:hypothetical protein
MDLVKWCPTLTIGGAKDRHTGSIYSGRDMSRASVIADKKVETSNQRGKAADRGLTSNVQGTGLHMRVYCLCDCLLAGATGEYDLRSQAPS